MATAMRVPTIFTAVDRFSHVVNTMSGSLSRFNNTAQAATARAGKRFNDFGNSALTIGVGMATGIGLIVNESVKYEQALASLAAVTGTKLGAMSSQIEELAIKSKRSVIEVAKSFEIVGSKMSEYLDDPIALQKITSASILMADAARMDLEPAINSLTGVMNIYKMTAEDAYRVVNKLSAGETVGSISIGQTADILSQFGAQAVAANVSVEESIALIQTLTKSLGVNNVGRGLRNILFDISSTATWDKNRWKAIELAKVDFKLVTDNSKKLVDRLRELKKLTNVSGATGLFFKRTNAVAANTLFQTFDQGEANLISFLDSIYKLDDAESKAEKNNATFAKKFKDLKNSIIFLAIKIGDVLLPILHDYINMIMPMISKTTKWVKENRRLIKFVFHVALALLYVGVVSKAVGLLLMSYSNTLWLAGLATKAYTEITWFLSLSFEGMAVAATYAAAGIWATIWPLALFGLAVWAVIDMVQHWEDWYEIILLCVGPLGWILLLLGKIIKHSDNIRNKFAFEGWGGGIKAIGIMLEDLILSPLIGIFNIMGRLISMVPGLGGLGSSFTEMASDLDASRHKIAPELSVGNLGMQGASMFSNLGGNIPAWDWSQKENLAGSEQSMMKELSQMLANGTLDINLNAPPGVIAGVNSEKASGVNVVVSPNQGKR